MSVEYCVVRVTPDVFSQLQQQQEILQDLMDEFYAQNTDPTQNRTYIDSRDVYRRSDIIVPSMLRMLYVDEFTTSLLVNFMDEDSAFFISLAGWGIAHVFKSVRYAYGEVLYYAPDEVKKVALQLNAYPEGLLTEWFREQAAHYRMASSGYFADDAAILTHQRAFADLLRILYNQAVRDGDFVLLLTV